MDKYIDKKQKDDYDDDELDRNLQRTNKKVIMKFTHRDEDGEGGGMWSSSSDHLKRRYCSS